MRSHFFNWVVDTDGRTLSSANISVYEAETSTDATVYDAESGGSSYSSAPQINSDSDGYFEFWVDSDDYDRNQKFKIVVSHSELASNITIDNVDIFGQFYPEHSARVYLSSNQSIPTSSEQKIEFDSTTFDTNSDWDAVNYRYTVADKGLYLVCLAVRLDSLNDGDRVYLRIQNTTNPIETIAYRYYTTSRSGLVTVNISALYKFNTVTTEYIEFFVWHNSSAARNVNSDSRYTYATVTRVGDY